MPFHDRPHTEMCGGANDSTNMPEWKLSKRKVPEIGCRVSARTVPSPIDSPHPLFLNTLFSDI